MKYTYNLNIANDQEIWLTIEYVSSKNVKDSKILFSLETADSDTKFTAVVNE